MAGFDGASTDAETAEAADQVCGLSVPTRDELLSKVSAAPREVWKSGMDLFRKEKAATGAEDAPDLPETPDPAEAPGLWHRLWNSSEAAAAPQD